MKGWIFFFSFLGLLCLISAISGVSQFTAELGRGTTIAMHPDLLSRIIAAAEGMVLLFIAWAIYRRFPWIWHLVFYFFGVCWAYSFYATYCELVRQYPSQPLADTIMFAGLIGLMSAAVGAYWSYKWFKKKAYFFQVK